MARSAAIERVVKAGRMGPFRIVAPLGEGGFAPVFLASEEYGGTELRTVALKLFGTDDLSASTGSTDGLVRTARDRIIEEARALCRVEHPNVVRFFQIVEDERSGALGLAMEHVRGTALSTRLDEGKRPSPDETLAIGIAVASALAAVHAVGLVHRDVKPGNVIDAGGVYKLIDFGIARAERRRANPKSSARVVVSLPPASLPATTDAGDRTLPVASVGFRTDEDAAIDVAIRTQELDAADAVPESSAAGTMGYIDPVVIGSGQAADASSDLYALGAMLYECLTGRLPASAGDAKVPSRLRVDIVVGSEPPAPVASLAPHVPVAFARFVDALVAPKREDRPKRADAVVSELERLRRVVQGRARALPGEGPFRGLEPFDARHRDVFSGRTTEIAAAIELLRTRGVVALVGASGSGKSSLARAGVLPAVTDGELGLWPKRWSAVTLSPGRFPKAALLQALADHLDDVVPPAAEAVAERLAANVETTDTGIVILLDALEELVTLAVPNEAAWVERFLAAVAAHPVPGLRIVATARADLLDALLQRAAGTALARGIQIVSPLSPATWLDAVDDRLAAYGFALEPDLRIALAKDLEGAASAMPLVEFALRELWNARDESRKVIAYAALGKLGGLGGALANHAEATLAAVLHAHGQEQALSTAHAMLVSLTTPHGTRAKPTRAELATRVPSPLLAPVLAAFEKARLVVGEGDVVTLAHDALVLRWPRLHAWVEGLRRDRELAAEIEEAAARRKANPERDALLSGRVLTDARALVRSRTVPLGDDALALVNASQRRALRSTLGIVALASSVFLGAIVLFSLYWMSERETRQEQEQAKAITRSLVATRNQPEAKIAKDIENLVAAKHECEKQLAKCTGTPAPTGSAGSPR